MTPLDPEEIDFESELESSEKITSGYSSPLVKKLSKTRLSLDLLRSEIPKVREAELAAEELKTKKRLGAKRQALLQKTINEGEYAKEKLFGAALPLIRAVAQREWRRRQQWGSAVPLEDLTQEAIVGFFKGISGFKVEEIKKSPTNYLGQWMLVEMRRNAEIMDHDLQVGHDAGERFRRIRALRGRLFVELGREPTDEEISAASRNPEYVTRPGMVGVAPKEGEKPKVGKGVTANQVSEERHFSSKVGHISRLGTSADEEENLPGVIDATRIEVAALGSVDEVLDPEELAMRKADAEFLADLIEQALQVMRLPDLQKEIIARRFALSPYTEESSAREIAREVGVHREKVSKVLSAFSEEMRRKGGAFHRIVDMRGAENIQAAGLGWLLETLGQWEGKAVAAPGKALTEDLDPTSASSPTRGTTSATGVLGWYVCDYEDRTFSALYPDEGTVPKTRSCPTCGRKAVRERLTPAGR